MPQTVERTDSHERTPQERTPVEKQRELDNITDRYFRNEINVDEFLKAQRELGPDVQSAVRAIAKRRVQETARRQHVPQVPPRIRFRDQIRGVFKKRPPMGAPRSSMHR